MAKVREYTNKLLEAMDEGMIEPKTLVEQLVAWMSEDDVRDFCVSYEYFNEEEEDTEEEDEDPMDDFNYVGSPHHY